jgi:NAD+ synthase
MTERATEFVVTLAQLNPTVGDVEGNAAKARAARERAKADGADLVVLPELFLAGYPPEDLVLKPAFQSACRSATEVLARETADGGPALLIGTPWVDDDDGKLYNACALLDGGRIAAIRYKVNLPNYGVFDEKRLFARGPAPGPVNIRGVRVGVPVCEDIWLEESSEYENVVECLAETGAEVIVVPNGSPYARDKHDVRLSIAVARVTESGLPLIYLNQVGGQDELVFDGASFALNADLSVAAQLPAFVENITTLRWKKGDDGGWRCSGPIVPEIEGDKADYAACVLGLRDYVRKNGFPGVLLGISGGIDSALCAAIAVDALGKEQVRGVMLPFRYTAQVSLDDAAKLAGNLDIRYEVLPIADAVNGFEKILSVPFAGLPRDITEENLQARARGTLLMAISNKTGAMVVTTGNKSEMSVGYATLYGDMNGGFNPIKDIYKTEVFRLSTLRNSWKPDGALGPSGEVIPPNIITRPPTAELRENQTDQDSLPPYDMLDAILERLVEREEPLASIVAAGFDREVVVRIDRLLNIAEYKRRQAAPGVKVTSRNFGRDRRYPITNRFRDNGKPLPAPDETLISRAARASAEAFDG